MSNLTDGYLPYHISDASGLGNSPVYTDGTNVGIGKVPESGKVLDVNGMSAFRDMSYWGTAGRTNWDNTWFSLAATSGHKLYLGANGVETGQMTIDGTTGSVGIGTTSPTSGYLLDVNGATISKGYKIGINTTLYAEDAMLSSYSTTNGVYLNGHAAGWLMLGGDGTQYQGISIYGGAAERIDFKTSNTQRLRLFSCLLYTSPSPRDRQKSRMPSSA